MQPLDDAVVALDATRGEARVLRFGAGGAIEGRATLTFDEGVQGVQTLARPGRTDEVLAVHQGRVGDADEETLDAELVLLGPEGERGRWTLDGPYLSFAPDEAGRYVLVSQPRRRLAFENRVEVVDLAQPGLTVPLSLRSLGGEVPTAAAFSPPLPGDAETPLRVAALFAAGQLSLFDLDAPETPPATIPTTVGGGAGPRPVEARFVGREVVVRTERSPQLLVLTLNDFEGDGGLRFDPSIRTLATNGPVRLLRVDERGELPRLLALAGDTLHLFDLRTGAETQVAVPMQHTDLGFFDGPAPGDPVVRPRVVSYGGTAQLTFVDLGAAPTEVLGTTDLRLQAAPTAVDLDTGGGRLVLYGGGGGPARQASRSPFAILDLFDRSATPLGVTSLDRAVLAPEGRSLWLAGTSDGYVGRLDLDGGQLEERFLTGTSITSLLPLAGGAERALVFVRGGDGLNRFRVLTPGELENGVELPRGAF
ncbi:MAG: hypothetical protein AAF447_05340 [Myxococcota bacterium]